MAEMLLNASILLISLAILFGVIRLIKGDTDTDRIIAVDLLSIVSMSVIVLAAHLADRFIYVDVAIVYGLLSFLGVLAVARYLDRGL